MSKSNILIIDDDVQICELLADTFNEYGFNTTVVHSGKDAVTQLNKKSDYALIFLDLILPDTNGLTLLNQIKNTTQSPVIMLSGLGSESDVVVGLEMGADDYIAKPFRPRIVVARAKAVIRRSEPNIHKNEFIPSTPGIHFDKYFLDTNKLKLFECDTNIEVTITQGEFSLLKILASHPQQVLSRQQILELTHNDQLDIYDRTIDVLIMRLRKKIEPNPKQPKYIRTVRCIGYIFSVNTKIIK